MNTIIGTWRLVRAFTRDTDGRELPPPYGGHGMGRAAFGADGRMMAVLCDARAEIPGGGKREYASYCGNYTFDGKQLITRVDCTLEPARLGGDQIRDVRFEDGLMVLRPPARSYGGTMEQRELFWEKIAGV